MLKPKKSLAATILAAIKANKRYYFIESSLNKPENVNKSKQDKQ